MRCSIRSGLDMERVQVVQEAAQGPLAGQHAAIAELRQAASSGEICPRQRAVLKQLAGQERRHREGPEREPDQHRDRELSPTGCARRLRSMSPTRMRVSRRHHAARQDRAIRGRELAGRSACRRSTRPTCSVQATLEKGRPGDPGAHLFRHHAAIPDEKMRNATFGKLAEGGPKAATQAYRRRALRQAPDVAASILRGQHAMEVDERNNPAKEGEGKQRFNDRTRQGAAAGRVLARGRTDPSGPYATMRGAAIARYADLTAQEGGKKDFSTARLQTGSQRRDRRHSRPQRGKFIAPQRGMPQATFDRVLWGVTDQDLAGVTTLAGEPVTADYLRGKAQLESYGDGRYLVRLGSDPMRPIYAVQNANTEMPQPFVLDLRGRKPAIRGRARRCRVQAVSEGLTMPLDMFGQTQSDTDAYVQRNNAPRLPATFGDTFDAAFNENRLFGQSIAGRTAGRRRSATTGRGDAQDRGAVRGPALRSRRDLAAPAARQRQGGEAQGRQSRPRDRRPDPRRAGSAGHRQVQGRAPTSRRCRPAKRR
jgi:hypothetical protein